MDFRDENGNIWSHFKTLPIEKSYQK